ncbi:hypothetical protein HK102_006336, partial [Quaeritorhiza haematococci]
KYQQQEHQTTQQQHQQSSSDSSSSSSSSAHCSSFTPTTTTTTNMNGHSHHSHSVAPAAEPQQSLADTTPPTMSKKSKGLGLKRSGNLGGGGGSKDAREKKQGFSNGTYFDNVETYQRHRHHHQRSRSDVSESVLVSLSDLSLKARKSTYVDPNPLASSGRPGAEDNSPYSASPSVRSHRSNSHSHTSGGNGPHDNAHSLYMHKTGSPPTLSALNSSGGAGFSGSSNSLGNNLGVGNPAPFSSRRVTMHMAGKP